MLVLGRDLLTKMLFSDTIWSVSTFRPRTSKLLYDRSSIQSRRTTSGEFYNFASLIPAEFPSRLTWQDFTDLRRQEYGIFFVANVDDGQMNLLNSVITFRMLVATADEFQAR